MLCFYINMLLMKFNLNGHEQIKHTVTLQFVAVCVISKESWEKYAYIFSKFVQILNILPINSDYWIYKNDVKSSTNYFGLWIHFLRGMFSLSNIIEPKIQNVKST